MCKYEPIYPPAWTPEEADEVEDDYYEIPRGLQPEKQ